MTYFFVYRLHNQGICLDVNALYPPVQYPVSRGTPSLADFATWNHNERLFYGVEELSQMVFYIIELSCFIISHTDYLQYKPKILS